MLALNMLHRVSDPVTTDQVVAECYTMTGVVSENGFKRTLKIVHSENWKIVIDRPTAGSSIHCKSDISQTPGES